MPLPLTDLTAQWDASSATDIYAGLDGSNLPTGAVAAGDDVGAWVSTVTTSHLWRPNTNVAVFNPPDITWEQDAALALPSIKITAGTMEPVVAGTLSDLQTDDFCTVSAKTVAFSFMLETGSLLTNNATVYLNTVLLGNPKNNYWGTFLRNDSGTLKLYAYNWDGGADSVNVTIALDTRYVVVVTHDGSTLSLTLMSESLGVVSENTQTTSSGNTTDIAVVWRLADSNAGGTEQAAIRIGEIATYNAALTGGELVALKSYMERWFFGDAPVQIKGSSIFGTDGTLTSTRTHLLNLDDVPRTVHAPGCLYLGGYFVLHEQGSAPTPIPAAAILFTQDNAGKTELMVQFPTGSAIQIAIEA